MNREAADDINKPSAGPHIFSVSAALGCHFIRRRSTSVTAMNVLRCILSPWLFIFDGLI
jgi:hypothetical protein